MEKTLVVANWKENKAASQAREWLELLSSQITDHRSQLEVVVCPSFVLIPVLYSSFSILHSPLRLGAQDVSQFDEGQYTGEVSAKMLKDFVKYVIVGHSERRKYFGETDEDVSQKIEQCLKYGLTPIACVSNLGQVSMVSRVSSKVILVYEPVEHISTGGKFRPDDPEQANLMAQKIKTVVGWDVRVLYGGSVTAENARSFVSQPDISGVLVGQASLDPQEFAKICYEIY